MKKIFLSIIISFVFWSSAARANDEKFTVFLFGDSLAEGLVPHFANDFKQENINFISMVKRGTTIRYWAHNSEFKKKMLKTSPDLVLISLGTNDMKMSNPLEETSDLINLLKICYISSNQVIWLLPPKMPFPDWGVEDMIMESKVTILPAPQLDEYRTKDKIHLTYKGYNFWADYVLDMLLGD